MSHPTADTYQLVVSQLERRDLDKLPDDETPGCPQHYQDSDLFLDYDSVLDLTVTFEGSWLTRGHTSLYGIGCVIEVHIGFVGLWACGLVLDLAVVSLYSQSCTHAKARYGGTHTAEYKTWKEQHTECN